MLSQHPIVPVLPSSVYVTAFLLLSPFSWESLLCYRSAWLQLTRSWGSTPSRVWTSSSSRRGSPAWAWPGKNGHGAVQYVCGSCLASGLDGRTLSGFMSWALFLYLFSHQDETWADRWRHTTHFTLPLHNTVWSSYLGYNSPMLILSRL